MRYERKYRIENLDFDSICNELNMHSAGFSDQFPERKINSIYFDDSQFSMARATLVGISNRCKYRIRWYGENTVDIDGPVLEKKIKSNQLGYKEFKKLPELNLKSHFKQFCTSNILSELAIYPCVYVSYTRTYLISFDQKVRVTIDRSIEYRSIENYKLSKIPRRDNAVVVEFKYDQQDAAYAEDMMNSFPFRLGKNSKYINALQALWV